MTQRLDGPSVVPTVTAPRPPANSVKTRFIGSLSFEDGYPTAATVEHLYDALDFQRATQALLRNIPALSMYGFRLGLARDLGVDAAFKLAIFRATATSLMLTPNSETVYGTTFLALDTDGPTVIDAPPRMIGLINDMWMRPVEDIGAGGPDQGQGGKYLIVPPGYEGALPETGYYVVRPQTYGLWVLFRALLDSDGGDSQAKALLRQTRIYPLALEALAPEMAFVEATGKPFDTTPPNDLRAFEWLADLIGREHPQAVDFEVAGVLQAIGIKTDVPFAPDDRMRAILGEAAQIGSFMAQAISYAARDPERVREGSQWLAGLEGYPTFRDERATLLDAMIYMTWFATGAAKAMKAPQPGTGSQYAWTYRDATGRWLRGEKTYRFRIPPNPPAKDFWSIIAYDNWTRAILANGQKVASKSSYDQAIKADADGAIDIYFGPEAPAGREANWVRTVPGQGWFALFRLYGPLEPWFDRSWTPDDMVEVQA